MTTGSNARTTSLRGLHRGVLFAALSVSTVLAGCAADAEDEPVAESTDSLHGAGLSDAAKRGAVLFTAATFQGNGRTCLTCHSAATGTISPRQVQARFEADPREPLFRSIDSDDGVGSQYTRLKERATIRVAIKLPSNVSIAGAPGVRTVVLNRGIPTVANTPALDKLLMVDGREDRVDIQALHAVQSHYQPRILPTERQLDDIEAFERSLFSSATLRNFASGGAAPTLPAGTTALERAGRRFFVSQPDPNDFKVGLCGGCHGGPMLDTDQNPEAAAADRRFGGVFVSELNALQNPVLTYAFTNPDGTTTPVESPDPGRALITGKAEHANTFRTPTLWGVKRTAPYFHDNSAPNLGAVVDQYTQFFDIVTQGFIHITPEDREQMVAYMKLL